MKTGFADKRLFPNLRFLNNALRFVEDGNSSFRPISNVPVSPKLANLNPEEVGAMMQMGKRLNIYRSMYGTLTYNFVESDSGERVRLDNKTSGSQALTLTRGELVSIISPDPGEVISGQSPIRINVRVRALPLVIGESAFRAP